MNPFLYPTYRMREPRVLYGVTFLYFRASSPGGWTLLSPFSRTTVHTDERPAEAH